MLRELIGIPISYKVKVSVSDFRQLQKIAVSHLGVKDVYALKDKFEGERYYNQFLQRSFAEIALQQYIGETFFEISEKNNKDFKPSFRFKGAEIQIVDCSFDEFPRVPVGNYDSLIICFVNLTSRDVWIAGKMNRKTAISESDTNLLSPMYKKSSYGLLKNLKILEPI